jgi:uroporphyrinogen-III synthase
LLDSTGTNIKTLPKIIVCGPGTARELRKYRVQPEAEPVSDFGKGGLVEIAKTIIKPDQKILRLRSDKAGTDLTEFLVTTGAKVSDCVLYRNETIRYDVLPLFDAVFFASSSAVEAFISQWGEKVLSGKTTVVIGQPTRKSLTKKSLIADVTGREETVASSLEALAEKYVRESMEK